MVGVWRISKQILLIIGEAHIKWEDPYFEEPEPYTVWVSLFLKKYKIMNTK